MSNQFVSTSRNFPAANISSIPSQPAQQQQQQDSSSSSGKKHYFLSSNDGTANGGANQSTSSISPLLVLKNLTILAITILVAIGAVTVILILYVVIRPFSLSAYRRLVCTIAVASFLDAMAIVLPNIKIFLTGDSDPLSPVGASVLVCNHVMNGDWWVILMLARCVGLKGSIKAFLQHRGTATHESIIVPHPAPVHGHGHGHGNVTGVVNGKSGLMHPMVPMHISRNPSHSTSMHPLLHASNPDVKPNPTAASTTASSATTHARPIPTSPSSSTRPCLGTTFLHTFLDFPLLSSENAQNYVQERNELFSLLRSFAATSATVPVHLLLFPEGCPEGHDRKSMIAKSVEFAKRDGRPQLKNLLLPRTTGFYASLESLREASTVVYDVTMAYRGFDGQAPFSCHVSLDSWMRLIQGDIPNEIHIRIKRYSIGEVLSDANWLDKQWTEKDRLLEHFERHGMFPTDNRGFCRHILMNTRGQSVESSLSALLKLGLIPFAIPVLLFLAVPLLLIVGWLWVACNAFTWLFPGVWGEMWGSVSAVHGHHDTFRDEKVGGGQAGVTSHDGGSDSAFGTPFFPATPFASPINVASWTSAPPAAVGLDSNKDSKKKNM